MLGLHAKILVAKLLVLSHRAMESDFRERLDMAVAPAPEGVVRLLVKCNVYADKRIVQVKACRCPRLGLRCRSRHQSTLFLLFRAAQSSRDAIGFGGGT